MKLDIHISFVLLNLSATVPETMTEKMNPTFCMAIKSPIWWGVRPIFFEAAPMMVLPTPKKNMARKEEAVMIFIF